MNNLRINKSNSNCGKKHDNYDECDDLAYTVVGRATGTSQIVGMAIVSTTVINSVLTVRNPAGNDEALTITPLAGGTRSVSAHLVITQIG